MSQIGKNIKKIRAVKKMSQADFAQIFNLARPSVGAYEEGRSEPKIDTLIEIAKHFNLSTDALLTKELTINDLYKFDIFRNDSTTRKQDNGVIDKDSSVADTPLVSTENMMEYIVNHTNKDFINKLPSFQFPFVQSATTRAFQIEGREMEYENCGIHHHDILLCAQIKKNEELEIGKLYVLVSEDGIRVRRLSDTNRNLTFKTDNPSYDVLHYSRNALLEIWRVKGYYSRNLEAPSRIEERLTLLEEQLREVKKSISQQVK